MSALDDVLAWARDGKWHVLEAHPEAVAEAIQQAADLRARDNQSCGNCQHAREIFRPDIGDEDDRLCYFHDWAHVYIHHHCDAWAPKEKTA